MAELMGFYDELETRSADQRAVDLARELPAQIARAQMLSGFADQLGGIEADAITDHAALHAIPVLRKTELASKQAANRPLGGFSNPALPQIFQSPGPIYEPGAKSHDWWRFGRFLHALGIGPKDIVQNCYSYHFTPAGMMFENAAEAVGARIFPAGVGQTELQARAAHDIGVTAYAGTPDYLKTILEKGDELGLDLSRITKAAVSGGPLFPQLRDYYTERGITCRQCYATADLGHIAFESEAMEGMIVDEGAIVEIVTPGTGNPVAPGEIGEILVTSLNPDYPLIRFATGDMSAIMPGLSPCGRSNMRIVGWRGRADQATKVKGMFVRPEQVADLVARNAEILRARVEVTEENGADQMAVKIETAATDSAPFEAAIKESLKLRGTVEIVPPNSLPRDGVVIADLRDHGG